MQVRVRQPETQGSSGHEDTVIREYVNRSICRVNPTRKSKCSVGVSVRARYWEFWTLVGKILDMRPMSMSSVSRTISIDAEYIGNNKSPLGVLD